MRVPSVSSFHECTYSGDLSKQLTCYWIALRFAKISWSDILNSWICASLVLSSMMLKIKKRPKQESFSFLYFSVTVPFRDLERSGQFALIISDYLRGILFPKGFDYGIKQLFLGIPIFLVHWSLVGFFIGLLTSMALYHFNYILLIN